MEGAHLHLLINHVPVAGSFFALLLLVASHFYAPDVLRRTAFLVLIGSALAAAVTELSGEPAEDAIRGFPGVQRALIHDHEEMGEKSLIVSGIVGVLALGALVAWRRKPVPAAAATISLVATLAVCGVLAYTALLGGRIRHTEVRPGATPADAAAIEPRRAGSGAPRVEEPR